MSTETLAQIETVKNKLMDLETRKRILIDEAYGLEYELDQAREEISELARLYWIERSKLDRLEGLLQKM